MPLTQEQAERLAGKLCHIAADGKFAKVLPVDGSPGLFYVEINAPEKSITDISNWINRSGVLTGFRADIYPSTLVPTDNPVTGKLFMQDLPQGLDFGKLVGEVEKIGLLQDALNKASYDLYSSVDSEFGQEFNVVLRDAVIEKNGENYVITCTPPEHAESIAMMLRQYSGFSKREITCNDTAGAVTLLGKAAEEVINLSAKVARCAAFESVIRGFQRSQYLTPEQQRVFAEVELEQIGDDYCIFTESGSEDDARLIHDVFLAYGNKERAGANISVQNLQKDGKNVKVLKITPLDKQNPLDFIKSFSDRMLSARKLDIVMSDLRNAASAKGDEANPLRAIQNRPVTTYGEGYAIPTDGGRAEEVLSMMHRYLEKDFSRHVSVNGDQIIFRDLGPADDTDAKDDTITEIAKRLCKGAEYENLFAALRDIPDLSAETRDALATVKVSRFGGNFRFDVEPNSQKPKIMTILDRYSGKKSDSTAVQNGDLSQYDLPTITSAINLETAIRSLQSLDGAPVGLNLVEVSKVSDSSPGLKIKFPKKDPQKTIIENFVKRFVGLQDLGELEKEYTNNPQVVAFFIDKINQGKALQEIVSAIDQPTKGRSSAKVIYCAQQNSAYQITGLNAYGMAALKAQFPQFVVNSIDGQSLMFRAEGLSQLLQSSEKFRAAFSLQDGLRKLWKDEFSRAGDVSSARVQISDRGELEIRINVADEVPGFKKNVLENTQKVLSGYFGRDLKKDDRTNDLIIPITADLESIRGVDQFLKAALARRERLIEKTSFDVADPVRVASSPLGAVAAVAGTIGYGTYLLTQKIPVVASTVAGFSRAALEFGASSFRLFGAAGLPGADGATAISRRLQDASRAIEASETKRLKFNPRNPYDWVSVPVEGLASVVTSIGSFASNLTSTAFHFMGDASLGLADRAVKNQTGVAGKALVGTLVSPLAIFGASCRAVGMITGGIGNALAKPAEHFGSTLGVPFPRVISDFGKTLLTRSRTFSREHIFVPEANVKSRFALSSSQDSCPSLLAKSNNLRLQQGVTMANVKNFIKEAAQLIPLDARNTDVLSKIAGDDGRYIALPDIHMKEGGRTLRPLLKSDGSVIIVDVNTMSAANTEAKQLSDRELAEFGKKLYEAVASAGSVGGVSLREFACGTPDEFIRALNSNVDASKVKKSQTDGEDIYSVNTGSETIRIKVGATGLQIKRSSDSEYQPLNIFTQPDASTTATVDIGAFKIISAILPPNPNQVRSSVQSAAPSIDVEAVHTALPLPPVPPRTPTVAEIYPLPPKLPAVAGAPSPFPAIREGGKPVVAAGSVFGAGVGGRGGSSG